MLAPFIAHPQRDAVRPPSGADSAMNADARIEDVDAALVARALAGQDVAFEALVVKYQRRVAATIRRLVRDDRIAEELTQEVFLRAFNALADFSAGGNFAAWLFTIARNAASSYLRSAQNRQDDRPVETATDEGAVDRLGAVSSPEDEVMARQLFDLIDAEIAGLPESQRSALLLREIDDLDYKSIAAALGQPVNTVKSHVFRAREAIAQRIRPLLAPTRGRRW
jgi:RNA polymerase sigma-70 factor (ECF subfamily)